MRLRSEHAKFVADKIAIDLLNSGFVKLTSGLEAVSELAKGIIVADIEVDDDLNARTRDLVDKQEEDIEFFQADRKQLFWMVKRRLAEEGGIKLNWEERLSDIAHQILDELYEEDLISYNVSENRIKNVIYKSIDDYLKRQNDIDNKVHEKITHYKRKVMYGTEEYDILYDKLYEEELRKLGL
jgi:hypothetical protein